MKIKKFKAKTFAGALELVKKELSEDAVILSTEEKKGFRPYVEVTAAVDYDQTVSEKTVKGQFVSREIAPEGERPSYVSSGQGEIKTEIEKLRETIEGMRNSGYEMTLPPKKRLLFNFLRERSVREKFALSLCRRAENMNEIHSLISSDVKVGSFGTSGKAVMLIGPTGVGKTTTIAKLSGHAIKEGKRAAIISLDTYRIGAIEQMRIYAKIMGIPFTVIPNIRELRDSYPRLSEGRDIVFIDTTGRNPMDGTYISDIAEVCSTELPVELHLLMSANSDDEFMTESYKFYSRLPIDCIAFTKVDEGVRFGSLYNLMLTYQKPVAYITTGQKVPGDLEFASSDRITSLILKKECYTC
jgi:flagellar biosynthesis protein FlhF